MTATTALRLEHERILSVIACLRLACAAGQRGDFDADTFRQAIDFIRNYADGWHHAKEEVHLFPALEAAGLPREGGPVAVMLHEHEVGRTLVRAMADHLEPAAEADGPARATVLQNAGAYADLLTAHIQKEDGILFNMADRLLPPDEHHRLEEAYESAIPDGADSGSGARYEQLARALCERWKIDPDEIRSQSFGGGGSDGR